MRRILKWFSYTICVLTGVFVLCYYPALLDGARWLPSILPDDQYVEPYGHRYFMSYPSECEELYYYPFCEYGVDHVYLNKEGKDTRAKVYTYLEYWQGITNYIYKVQTVDGEILWLKRKRFAHQLTEVDISTVSKWRYFPRYRFGSLQYVGFVNLISAILLTIVYVFYILLLLLYSLMIAIKKKKGLEIPDHSQMLPITFVALFLPAWCFFVLRCIAFLE